MELRTPIFCRNRLECAVGKSAGSLAARLIYGWRRAKKSARTSAFAAHEHERARQYFGPNTEVLVSVFVAKLIRPYPRACSTSRVAGGGAPAPFFSTWL